MMIACALDSAVTPVSPVEALTLKQDGSKVLAEYIWLGSSGADLKSRTVALDDLPEAYGVSDLPLAAIEAGVLGYGAADACGELYLQPKKIFSDPFRGGNHILVLCDTYVPPVSAVPDPWEHMQPHCANHRAACELVMQQAGSQQPVFTMQQEYTFISDGCPVSGGFMMGPMPVPKTAPGLTEKAAARLGREVSELHMQACLAAGLSYSGGYASSTHQYSFTIGPCLGVDMADQLSMSRFLLHRVAAHSEAGIHYDTLGRYGVASSNKCTVQFSTANSRDPHSGLSAIQDMMERLHCNQVQHICSNNCFGPGSAASGTSGSWHSSSGFSEHVSPASNARFSVGLGSRHASIMVPTSTLLNKCGPIMDRRPPAGSDPYLTTMLLVASACGIPLPQPTRKAMQLAASLAAAAACGNHHTSSPKGSMGVPIPSSQRPSHSCAGFSVGREGFCSAAPTCSFSGLSGSADSEDVLLSALDKLDGYRSATAPRLIGSCIYDDEDACSDICSDACSPPLASSSLAGAAEASDAMYFE